MVISCFPRYSSKAGRIAALLETEACALDEWSSWSSCTTTCGPGHSTRSRNFREKKHRKQCRSIPDGPELQQTMDCENDPCSDEDADEVREASDQVEEGDDNGDEEQEQDQSDDQEQDNGDGEDYEGEEPAVEATEEWLQVQNFVRVYGEHHCAECRVTTGLIRAIPKHLL